MNPAVPRPRSATSTTVEQAQGVLMACYGCDAPTALALLTRVSASRDVGLAALAAAVVDAAVRHHGPPDAATSATPDGPVRSPCEEVRLVLHDVPTASVTPCPGCCS